MSYEDVMDREWTDKELGVFDNPMIYIPQKLVDQLFERKWNGVVGSGCKFYWQISGTYRHTLAKMIGATFEEAALAACKE